MRSSGHTGRIRLLWVLIAFAVVVYGARLYWLQVMRNETYADQALHQYASASGSVFDRGSILFSDKNGGLTSAATLKSGFTLAINPSKISDINAAYETISSLISVDRALFFVRAEKKEDQYEEVARRLDENTVDTIKAQELPWMILSQEKWRYYPGATLAAHALGFVGYDGDVLSGRYGLERYYEDALSRSNRDPYRNFLVDIFSTTKRGITKGFEGDIVSAIEPKVQTALEGELRGINEQWSPDTIGGIVINPKSGAIYAMAVFPTFDPNTFSGEKDAGVFSNPVVESVFEMGSIIKPLTMAVGLDTGSVSADTTYNDEGTLVLNGSRISNFDKKGRGKVNMQTVLNQSLNTGAVFVERKVGNARFAEYFRNLGLGEETGIDLPGETHGLIDNLNSPRDIEYATASFGQGIAMTPIETVRALSALGNGGWLVTPHVAASIRYEGGITRSLTPEDRTRVFQSSTSEEITRMLIKVFDEALLKGTVKMKNYSIAAKTGTAQMAREGGGGYYDDRYLHSFFGYFPAYDPQFLVFFFAVNPKGVQYASETLTHPFVAMAKFLIAYYQIPPDR